MLDFKDILIDLARAECEFVVIGSSALALQGWEVEPTDLDLFVRPDQVDATLHGLGVRDGVASWVEDGAARRLEYELPRGKVDIYIAVSGRLSYEEVLDRSSVIRLGVAGAEVRVGSPRHVRDMRAAVGRTEVPADAVVPAEKAGVPRVIAIDGPAGAGKSTVTRSVADQMGLTYLDTGAMYRSVALAVLQRRADTDDPNLIAALARGADIQFRGDKVFLDGQDVSEEIRSHAVTRAAPHIAAYPEVRQALVERQRNMFAEGGWVVEGRDTGTVVAPDAPLKIFLTASAEERARRRALETGEPVVDVLKAIDERDRLDSERKLSALRAAEDAVVVDTTGRPVGSVVDEIVSLARERGIA
jgi:CMP/dCMP kinase